MLDKKTLFFKVDAVNPEQEIILQAGKILKDGGLVAFPTETVYGLGANALDGEAVAGIFKAKGRPSDNPLIVHIAGINDVEDLAEDITVPARRLMEAFWPGPLTVILPKKQAVPDEVTAGLDTVAIRIPDHPIALSIIKAAGVPIAAPSANSSGKPSPSTAAHVLEDLNHKIDMIIDGGACKVGLESTVIDLTSEPPVILRPGAVTREDIEGVVGRTEIDQALIDDKNPPKAPGMKYKHYSPEADVIVVTGQDYEKIFERVSELVNRYRWENKKVGVLATLETARGYNADVVFPVGTRAQMETIAQSLYYGLRYMDEENVDVIIAEGYPETGIGLAIMNRLKKAAGYTLISV